MKRREKIDNQSIDKTLGLFGALSRPELEAAEERASRRFGNVTARTSPVTSPFVSVEPGAENAAVRGRRWRLAMVAASAAVFLAVVIGGIVWRQAGPFAVVETADGSVYRIVNRKTQRIPVGERLDAGQTVRMNGGVSAVLKLADGSRVEMRSQSELSLGRTEDGVRIHLQKGGIIVNAAKQRFGRHLYVQTRDVGVSVVGTVFFVNAEAEGSRVAVYEGEVRVQQGATETKLGPGEYVATSPAMSALPVREAIEWSREAPVHLASLQPRETFEEVSIRPSSEGIPRGANPNIRACDGGSTVQIDPNRFSISRRNIYMLITMAYFGGGNLVQGCLYANRLGLLTGGPSWIQSDLYDIQAVIPVGSFSSTPTIRDPRLQRMVQSLLADRFKLTLRREMKEMPVYVMTVTLREPANAASKDAAVWLTKPMAEQSPMPAQMWSDVENRQGLVAYENGETNARIYGVNATMSELATTLGRLMGRPVLDRTSLASKVNFYLETFSEVGDLATPPLETRSSVEIKSIIAELAKQAGIKLELSKDKIEVLTIDHIERPSEN